jgi:hypothetical protein
VRITVVYNGVEHEIDGLRPSDGVAALLGQCMQPTRFGMIRKAELLAFFPMDGREIRTTDRDGQRVTLEDAGIHNGERLLLRTTVVR